MGAACSMDATGVRAQEEGEGGGGAEGQASTNEGGVAANQGSQGGGVDGPRTNLVDGSSEAAADAVALQRGPTPAIAGVAFPFPQNRQSSQCVYPSRYDNNDVLNAYAKWKTDVLVSNNAGGHLRVQRTSSDGIDACRPLNSTVSEGIGYGMLVAVYMNDQNTFDQLWLYEQQNTDLNGLMNWAPNGLQGDLDCGGAATDADEDMAFALAMAAKQWGGQGALSKTYAASALQQIQTVWANEIWNYSVIIPGDEWGASADPSSFANINVSYFAPAYYRVFAALDPMAGSPGGDDWAAAIVSSYSIINLSLNATNGNQSNGLVPAWCSSTGGLPGPDEPTNYQYDSCRTPFRIGLDWCWNAEPRAQTYLGLTSAFFSAIGAPNIADGYALNGTPAPANPGMLSAAFIGPAGVGAMSSSVDQPFVNSAYSEVATLQLLAGGAYYEDSWTILSLLMMSANFLDYTAY
jgi:endo-1,4-beta-D-glucanase Y